LFQLEPILVTDRFHHELFREFGNHKSFIACFFTTYKRSTHSIRGNVMPRNQSNL